MPLSPTVILIDARPCTTSLAIAECFGKRHDAVLRDIRNLIEDCPENFRLHNFVESAYVNEQGKEQPMYNVFFDGFMLLVMSYTGKKALEMKLAYIEAFNAMREKLAAKQAKKAVSAKKTALAQKDKYESYMEEVEAFRARTSTEIDRLLSKGLDLVDVCKFGSGGIIGFTPILFDWLKNIAGQHTPLISDWQSMDRAIDYSPLCLIKRLDAWLPDRRIQNK